MEYCEYYQYFKQNLASSMIQCLSGTLKFIITTLITNFFTQENKLSIENIYKLIHIKNDFR